MFRRLMLVPAVIALLSLEAAAQPVIRTNAPPVLNAASYRTPGLGASGIAQGSIFSVFGTGFGPSSCLFNPPVFPLPTKLTPGDASVDVTVGGATTHAVMLLACDWQINAILPSNTPVGTGTLTVSYNGRTSAPAPIQVVASAFGIFTATSMGSGQASVTDVNYAVNNIIHTFHPGDYGILWGTGLGPISGSDAAAPPVGNLAGTVKVYVGNTSVTPSYYGRSGCCSGVDQIVFQVPQGVQGCHVPIAVETGGGLSNVTTIAVSANGNTCSDSVMGQDMVDKLASGQNVKFGYIRLESRVMPIIAGPAFTFSTDYAYATFSEFTPATAGWAQYGVSSGYCVAVDCSTGCPAVKGFIGSLADSSRSQLDAGATVAVRGAGVADLASAGGYFPGFYAGTNANGNRFLWSDLSYTASSTGGRVGDFSASTRTGLPVLQFTGLRSGQSLPRSADLTVEWGDGDPALKDQPATIGAFSATSDFSQFVWLQCKAPVAAKKFTIPSWILSTLPASGSVQSGSATIPLGWVWIGQYSKPSAFQAPGLDKGLMTDVFFNGLGLYFQ